MIAAVAVGHDTATSELSSLLCSGGGRRSCGRRTKRPFSAQPSAASREYSRPAASIGAPPVTSSSFTRCMVGTALAAFLVAPPIELSAQAPSTAGSRRHDGDRQLSRRAPCRAGTRCRQRPRPFTARRCGAIPKMANCSTARSCRCWSTATVEDSVPYAEHIAKVDKNDRVARLVLGVHALKKAQYAAARRELAQSVRGPITDLTATLLTAWSYAGRRRRQRRAGGDRPTCRAPTGTRSSRICMPA